MRALLPSESDNVDLIRCYGIPERAAADRPFVRCNMISTLDGAVTMNGRSGNLGGAADRQIFQVLRSQADVILVGAGTVRAEGYGPVRLDDELRGQRQGRGLTPVPPIAVVTRSGNLDWSAPFFTEAEERPLVLTTSDVDAGEQRRGEQVADFVVTGDDQVDPHRVLDQFKSRGYRSVLLEGGPRLNADVVHAGLLDELCLTLSPRLVAGDGPRVLAGPELPSALDLDVVHLLEDGGFLFLRLAVRTEDPA